MLKGEASLPPCLPECVCVCLPCFTNVRDLLTLTDCLSSISWHMLTGGIFTVEIYSSDISEMVLNRVNIS